MLIWIATSIGPAGVDQGVVRARDAQSLMEVDNMHLEMSVQRQKLLDQAAQEADAAVAAAHEQAAELIAEASADADRMRSTAYDEGMQQAVQDWHERGLDAAIDKEAALRGTHVKLAEIVTNAVERIVHSEDRAALYQRALKNVQSLTRGASALRLRVGQADHASALASIEQISDHDTAGLKIEVVADPSLRPGACIFESDVGVLDASIETQLDALRSAMSRAVRRASLDDEPAPAADEEFS